MSSLIIRKVTNDNVPIQMNNKSPAKMLNLTPTANHNNSNWVQTHLQKENHHGIHLQHQTITDIHGTRPSMALFQIKKVQIYGNWLKKHRSGENNSFEIQIPILYSMNQFPATVLVCRLKYASEPIQFFHTATIKSIMHDMITVDQMVL